MPTNIKKTLKCWFVLFICSYFGLKLIDYIYILFQIVKQNNIFFDFSTRQVVDARIIDATATNGRELVMICWEKILKIC